MITSSITHEGAPRAAISVSGPRRLRSAAALAFIFLALLAIPMVFMIRGEVYGLASDRPAPDFQLRDINGAAVGLSDFAGKHLFLMFGYLNCPDVCHTQALTFEEIALTAGNNDDLAFAYIAIDPERDSPEQVAGYFDMRGDNFTSLHGDNKRTLTDMAMAYKAFFSRRGAGTDPAYLVDHTGLFFLIGPDGHLRYTYAANQNATPRLVDDLRRLRHEYKTDSGGPQTHG